MKTLIKLLMPFLLTLTASQVTLADAGHDTLYALSKYYPRLVKDSENIWPGFNIASMPIVLKDPYQQRLYAINLSPKHLPWQKFTLNSVTAYQLNNYSDSVLQNKQSSVAPFGLEAATIDEQKAFIDYNDISDDENYSLQPLLADRVTYYLLAESPYDSPKRTLLTNINSHYAGLLNSKNSSLIYLEAKTLTDYLSTKNVEFLKDYLAVYHTRTKELSKEDVQFETNFIEALTAPEVVSSIALNIPATDSYVQDAINSSYLFTINDPAENALITFGLLCYTAGIIEQSLEMIEPTWKTLVARNNLSPSEILQQHYPLSDKEVTTRIANIKTRYNYEKIHTQLENSLHPYLENSQIKFKAYSDTPGILTTFNDGIFDSFPFYSSDMNQYVLDWRTALFEVAKWDEDIAPPTVTIQNIPFIFQDITQGQFIKLPLTSKIMIDGKLDTLTNFTASNKQISFTKLSITDATATRNPVTINVDLTSYKNHGSITVKDHQLLIQLPFDIYSLSSNNKYFKAQNKPKAYQQFVTRIKFLNQQKILPNKHSHH